MIKRASSRNSRSKGVRAKQILQICLLLGVCFWLIYQVKRSHDKKKELDDKDANLSISTQTSDGILKLGRKDLDPRDHAEAKMGKNKEDDSKGEEEKDEDDEHEKDDGQTNFEDQDKQEENKYEEEEQDGDAKSQETEDDGKGGADDETDQEKVEGQVDGDEEFIEDEKEREEAEEEESNNEAEEQESNNEAEEQERNEVEDKGDGTDHESDDQGLDVNDESTHKAKEREENYKADDASSAVTHHMQNAGTENDNASSLDSDEIRRDLEQNSGIGNNGVEEVDGGKNNLTGHQEQALTTEVDPLANVKNGEKRDDTIAKDATTALVAKNQTVKSNESSESSAEVDSRKTDLRMENSGAGTSNGTIVMPNSEVQNSTRDEATAAEVSEWQKREGQLDNGNMNSDGLQSGDNTTKVEDMVKAKVNYESSMATNTTENASHGEISGMKNDSEGTNEMTNNSDETHEDTDPSSKNDPKDAAINDPIDSSDSTDGQEEKEARIDLGTLPVDNTTEGVNSRNAAVE